MPDSVTPTNWSQLGTLVCSKMRFQNLGLGHSEYTAALTRLRSSSLFTGHILGSNCAPYKKKKKKNPAFPNLVP